MANVLSQFEIVVRKAKKFTEAKSEPQTGLHPFDERDIHTGLPTIVKDLFDNGHFPQATFEAYKFIDKEIQRHSKSKKIGFKLMMEALAPNSPKVQLTEMKNDSEKDEQQGFQFIFAGAVLAIRNPRGHEYNLIETPDQCLDNLCLASLLLRRLEKAGYKCKGS
jgi:uncharacterized protein (TIGR02391 family)